jgi:hypothetical protein
VHGVYGRRQGASVVVAVAAFALAACSGGSAAPGSATSSSSTTATVPGPSTSLTAEQQAAEEAKQAYATYRQTVDRVFQRGGTNARGDLSKVATGAQLTYLLDQAAAFEKNRWRAVGSPTIRSMHVDETPANNIATSKVVLRVCDDATTTDAVDSDGRSIRKPGALAHFIELVTIVRPSEGRWLVSQEDDTPVKSC